MILALVPLGIGCGGRCGAVVFQQDCPVEELLHELIGHCETLHLNILAVLSTRNGKLLRNGVTMPISTARADPKGKHATCT